MKNKLLLDTSVIISLLRNDGKSQILLRKVVNGKKYGTSSICLAELYEGVERSDDGQKTEKELLTLILPLEVYNFTRTEAVIFGKLRAQLKKLGKVIEDMDLLIASTCLANNLTLVTLNKQHFQRIAGLKILT